MTHRDPTHRFSGRVADYVKHRPTYPVEVLAFLGRTLGLRPDHVVADIGSGTGIFSRMVLDNGNRVIGVEPNAEMRGAAERDLRSYPGFTSQAGTAEATGLADGSVDFVTAAQAFHWFDPAGARAEFSRILRVPGWVVLLWNRRRTEGSAFLRAYEDLLLEFGTDYQEVNHATAEREARIPGFFGGRGNGSASFENAQDLDFEGLKGRLLSSSYVPAANHPRFSGMIGALRVLFDRHQQRGQVRIEYDVVLHYGSMSKD